MFTNNGSWSQNHLLSSLLLVAAFRKRNALRRQIQTQTYLIKVSMTAVLIGFGDFVYDKPSEFFVRNKNNNKQKNHQGIWEARCPWRPALKLRATSLTLFICLA